MGVTIMSKVLCFSYERMFYPDNILSGPGSRLWEIAQTLKRKGHKITIAELNHDKDYTKDGIKFISWDTQRLKNIEKEFDVAFLPLSAYVDQYFDKIIKIPTVVDLSTPIAIEAMAHSIGDKDNFFLNDGLLPTFKALENGDYFICSNNAQKYFYLGMITLLGINNFNTDLIQIAPLAPRTVAKGVNKDILKKTVGKNKKMLLFLGGLYSWYDYKTPILAMEKIIKKQKNAVLVFVGAFNPNIPELTENNYNNAKTLAKSLNLLDKSVFFIDWVSSEDRSSVYAESDIAIVTSQDTSESLMSYRMRIIDYLQGNLPVVCTRNDELSEMVTEQKLGETVSIKNADELGKTIVKMLSKKSIIQSYQKNIQKYIKTEFNIDKTMESLNKFCNNPKFYPKHLKLNYLKIIDEQKSKIKNLEYIKDDKEGVNKSLVGQIKSLEGFLNNRRKEVTRFQARLKELEKEIKQKYEEIDEEKIDKDFLRNTIDDKKKKILYLQEALQKSVEKHNNIIEDKDKHISNLRTIIGKYRASIVYPFYKVTHIIGKTKIGKTLQKLLK